MRICGLDEVGRGALAGPLVAAGVCLSDTDLQLRDSKQLGRTKRELLFQKILDSGAEIVIEEISVEDINKYGIGWANIEIFKRIIDRIEADKYIVDGNLTIYSQTKGAAIESLIRADQLHPSVMAASIMAKVTRDATMRNLHLRFPQYVWGNNCGYGTRKHIEALIKYGPSLCHRDVFVSTAIRNALTKMGFSSSNMGAMVGMDLTRDPETGL